MSDKSYVDQAKDAASAAGMFADCSVLIGFKRRNWCQGHMCLVL